METSSFPLHCGGGDSDYTDWDDEPTNEQSDTSGDVPNTSDE